MVSPSIAGLSTPEAPFDPALIAQMANALFAARPGESAALPSTPPVSAPSLATVPPGVQAPGNVAPAGSPLSSPAGFGPSVPGTPIPQGQVPGTNLIPAAPGGVLSLANRLPSSLPHAAAGNGLPDTVATVAPAFEPRFGGAALGAPEASAASGSQALRHPAASATPFYFLADGHGQPSPGGRPVPAATAPADPLDAFALQPLLPPNAVTPVPPSGGLPTASSVGNPATPAFYFVDAVQLPNGFVTPAKPAPHATVPLAGQGQHPPFDVHTCGAIFPSCRSGSTASRWCGLTTQPPPTSRSR